MMEYNGYSARVEFDDSIESFHGRVLGIRDVITFEGKTVASLKKAFHEAVDDYLEWCKEEGRTPEKPASGKLQLRIGSELHRRAIITAESRGESLNSFLVACVEAGTRTRQ